MDVERQQAFAVSEGNRALVTDALMERIREPKNLNRGTGSGLLRVVRP